MSNSWRPDGVCKYTVSPSRDFRMALATGDIQLIFAIQRIRFIDPHNRDGKLFAVLVAAQYSCPKKHLVFIWLCGGFDRLQPLQVAWLKNECGGQFHVSASYHTGSRHFPNDRHWMLPTTRYSPHRDALSSLDARVLHVRSDIHLRLSQLHALRQGRVHNGIIVVIMIRFFVNALLIILI